MRKHQPGQESDGQTGSWCLDKAVQLRDARYQRKHIPKTCPYLTLSTIVVTGRFWWGCGIWGQLWALPSCNSSVVESAPQAERPMIVAGACSPVDRTYVTAKPGVTTLVMAGVTPKQRAVGCSTKQNVVMSRRTHHKLETALFPSTIGTRSRFAYFLTVKAEVRKVGKSDGQTGSWCLDKAVLAQRGGTSA